MELALLADQLAEGVNGCLSSPFLSGAVAASAANLTSKRNGFARAHLSINLLFDKEPSERGGRFPSGGGGGGINKKLRELGAVNTISHISFNCMAGQTEMQPLEIKEVRIADIRLTSLLSTTSFTNGLAPSMQKQAAVSVSSALCEMIQ